MARRESQAEQKMHDVQEKADILAAAEYPGYIDLLHSWAAGELVLDIKDIEGNWHRMVWIPEDDMEIAGVQGLA